MKGWFPAILELMAALFCLAGVALFLILLLGTFSGCRSAYRPCDKNIISPAAAPASRLG